MRCFALLIAVAGATLLSKAEKEYPVTKVINLLKDMQSQLQTEQETDQEVFEKLACWCETNKKEKSAAIDNAQTAISELVSTIEEKTAKSSKLTTEIEAVTEEVSKNEEALNQATAIREKELGEFNAEEKDVMQSIQALGNAVEVLGRQHKSEEALLSVKRVLKQHLHHKAIEGKISELQSRTVTAFLQQAPGMGQSYAPQSGQIFGLLKQMKETFETNLAQSQSDESGSVNGFNELKTAKTTEIKSGKKQVRNKSVELANTDELNSQAKEDLKDTRGALSADQKFVVEMNLKCSMTDAEFQERQKARGEEISAVSEAIAILSDDSAKDLYSKTLGFVQKKDARSKAVLLLKAAAKKSGSTELAALATTVQLDAFTKVQKSIDEMVTALLKEKEDEIAHKDYCNKAIAENELQTAVQTDEKNDLEAEIGSLEAHIDTLTKDLADLKSEIAEMHVQTKRASEDRELENKEFQQTVADQRATQGILKKALDRLKVVYGFVQTKVQLKQEPGAAAPPSPPGFSEYKKNAGASGVLTMIQEVITDAKKMESEAIKAENDAQAAYESFVKNTNDVISADQKSIVAKTESKAKAEQELTQAKSDLAACVSALESLAATSADLHKSCDFVLQNFDVRQTARDEEVEGLRQAKAVFNGADLS